MISRRGFGRIALAAWPLARALAKINSRIHGVQIGVQSYSFRDRPLDAAIQATVECGLGECELWEGHVEPKLEGEELRKWRLTVPLDNFKQVRRQFDDAGIRLLAYNLSFNDSFSDEEIDRGFAMAKALGVDLITASSTLPTAKRVAPYAEKHKIKVAMHGHSNVSDPNQFATPESFSKAMELSPWLYVNLDIGHFFAAGYDPVAYIREHHGRISVLHIKDRKPNQGAGVPFGEGGTPIKESLQWIEKNHWPIPGNIEYEYPGKDAVAEVKKCYEYCKQALT